MKIKLGIRKKLLMCKGFIDFFRFWLLKKILGFDSANKMIQYVNKESIQMILKRYGALIGYGCDIETGLIFHNCQDYSNLVVGENCHIGKNCFFDLRSKIVIEKNVVISMKTTFVTHQDMNQSGLRLLYPVISGNITIRNNSYVGTNTTILQGVEVGKYSIIAAGSVVNRNVPKKTLAGGVPVKLIKKIVNI